MRDGHAPTPVRRADYAPPAYWIRTAEFIFDLDPAKTIVSSRLGIERNPSAPAGQPLKLQIDLGEPAAATPAQQLRSEQQERHNQAVQALEQDGFVRDMIDLFDASLNESSIKPL